MSGLESFFHAYNFIKWFAESKERDVRIVLFSVEPEESARLESAMEVLKETMRSVLTPADAFTRYSDYQVIAAFAETESFEHGAERIAETFKKQDAASGVVLSYDTSVIAAGKGESTAESEEKTAKVILVVDDNPTNLMAVRSAIDNVYKVVPVTDGRQALAFLDKHMCDLILLDINMPVIDGFEVMRRIRELPACADIPIIFLTAESSPESENRCLEAGAVDFIAKPFSTQVLLSRIGRCLELEELKRNLRGKVAEKTKRITQIQNKTVLGMATMVESRDNSTGGHIMRTKDVVDIFARHLYDIRYISDADYLKEIVRAAPMHDLGKIAVDDKVLRKDGKFDEDEYREMKKHSAEGAKVIEKMLRGVEEDRFVDIAVNVARHHHERWDGKGYPDGLAGEDIPKEARIMAFADVFDALVSIRCYKQAYSYDKAFSIIEECLGTQFDPELGSYFMECRGSLEALYDSYGKE